MNVKQSGRARMLILGLGGFAEMTHFYVRFSLSPCAQWRVVCVIVMEPQRAVRQHTSRILSSVCATLIISLLSAINLQSYVLFCSSDLHPFSLILSLIAFYVGFILLLGTVFNHTVKYFVGFFGQIFLSKLLKLISHK